MRTLSGRIVLPDGSTVAGLLRFETIISAIEHSDTTSSDYILPGFVDLQVNGSHGVDVMTATADGILEISDRLAREGTTAWLPTAITSPIDRIENVHRTIGEAIERQRDAPRGARILGLHLEGPFISPLRLGAHPQRNLEPRGEAFERVMALEHLKLVTLAPELPGALEATRRLTSREVVVSIGHTNATFEEASAGVAAGARMFTHLFNAMRPLNHRDPGAIAAALTNEVAMPAVIPDGVHLAPEILRLIYMTRGARRMILTTDKVSLAGTESAKISGGAARLADGTLAGAIISMLDGARLLMEKAGASIAEAAVMAASNPASLIGHAELGRLQPGAVSDIIVLNDAFELKAVFLAGRELN